MPTIAAAPRPAGPAGAARRSRSRWLTALTRRWEYDADHEDADEQSGRQVERHPAEGERAHQPIDLVEGNPGPAGRYAHLPLRGALDEVARQRPKAGQAPSSAECRA